MSPSLSTCLETARKLVREAGKITLKYYQTELETEIKADSSPVTIADKRTETFLRDQLNARFPQHAVLGEEEGLTGDQEAPWRWLIDPIDGTQSFIRGVPFYGVMLGLLYEENPVLGVIHFPALKETISAADNLGCWWQGRPCRVSDVDNLPDSLLLATAGKGHGNYRNAEGFKRLVDHCGRFRTWGDCYGYLMVATGRAEIMVDPALSPWDVAPLIPILREAGGIFSSWTGEGDIHCKDGVATNRKLYEKTMEIISG